MKRALVIIALIALAVAGVAAAQPPSGISRPSNEGQLSDGELGAQLYAGNCASCHGVAGQGSTGKRSTRDTGNVEGRGPSLQGVGEQAADFYLRTGYMPLRTPDEQPWRRRVLFTKRELNALIKYVGKLGGGGPPIPKPAPEHGHLAEGLRMFTTHCAGCHQVVGEGGYVTDVRVPRLKEATPTQIAEAVRIGPYLMPRFSKKAISDRQLDSIVSYIEASKKPHDRGGWGIGHIGPVPEGMVAWLIAGLVLTGLCALIGERIKS
jgi:ubiquinol-cytochrome c reductase cytochrome c subunit